PEKGGLMVRSPFALVLVCACQTDPSVGTTLQASHRAACDWTQWGGAADHGGDSCAAGQPLQRTLAQFTIDPFAAKKETETRFPGFDARLLVHYPTPLIEGDDVFVMQLAGTYVSCDPPGSGEPFPCGPDSIDSQTWTEVALEWRGDELVRRWTFTSD